jgi:hypothetical protein
MKRQMMTGLALLLATPALAQTSEELAREKELLSLRRDIAKLEGELADQKWGFLKDIEPPKSELKLGDGAMEAVVLAGKIARAMAGRIKDDVAGQSPILLLAPNEQLALDLGAAMKGRIEYTRNALSTVLRNQCLLSDPLREELSPARLRSRYAPAPAPDSDQKLLSAMAPVGTIISGVASLLGKAFSVDVNVKDVPISTDAGFLWAETAKILSDGLRGQLITPSLALGVPAKAEGPLYGAVFGAQPDSLDRLFGKATACLGTLSQLKGEDAKTAAAQVKAVTDATDTFVKAVSVPDAKGVVPLLEADRQQALADRLRDARVLRLRIHQAGGGQMTRKSGFGPTRASMNGVMLSSYTLSAPDGTILKANTFICGASTMAGKKLASPDDVNVQCN